MAGRDLSFRTARVSQWGQTSLSSLRLELLIMISPLLICACTPTVAFSKLTPNTRRMTRDAM